MGSGQVLVEPNHAAGSLIRTGRNQRGFSLPEVLATLAVSALTLAALYQLSATQAKVYSVQNQVADMQETTGALKKLIRQELAMAGYRPVTLTTTCTGAPVIGPNWCGITVDTTQLAIQADLNGNGVIDTGPGTRESVVYAYDNANRRVLRTAGGVPQIFPNIKSFTFTYLQSDGTATTSAADNPIVREVAVSIVGRTSGKDPTYPINNGRRTVTLSFSVTPRNLGS